MYIFHFQSVPPKKENHLKIKARDIRAAIEFVEQNCPGAWDIRAQTDLGETELYGFFRRDVVAK